MNLKIEVVLAGGTSLSFDNVKDKELGYFRLDDVYTLSPSYKLYRLKGNVLCGEEVEYKELSIKITK